MGLVVLGRLAALYLVLQHKDWDHKHRVLTMGFQNITEVDSWQTLIQHVLMLRCQWTITGALDIARFHM